MDLLEILPQGAIELKEIQGCDRFWGFDMNRLGIEDQKQAFSLDYN